MRKVSNWAFTQLFGCEAERRLMMLCWFKGFLNQPYRRFIFEVVAVSLDICDLGNSKVLSNAELTPVPYSHRVNLSQRYSSKRVLLEKTEKRLVGRTMLNAERRPMLMNLTNSFTYCQMTLLKVTLQIGSEQRQMVVSVSRRRFVRR